VPNVSADLDYGHFCRCFITCNCTIFPILLSVLLFAIFASFSATIRTIPAKVILALHLEHLFFRRDRLHLFLFLCACGCAVVKHDRVLLRRSHRLVQIGLWAILGQEAGRGVIVEVGLQILLLFVLVELADHHFIERARLIVQIRRKVFKEQELLLLVHEALLARPSCILLLCQLVLRGDRLSELG